jgi:hypothetical protein
LCAASTVLEFIGYYMPNTQESHTVRNIRRVQLTYDSPPSFRVCHAWLASGGLTEMNTKDDLFRLNPIFGRVRKDVATGQNHDLEAPCHALSHGLCAGSLNTKN